jgi:hypothetical protein
VEQLRKYLSFSRLHRCHACGWRGWGAETTFDSPALERVTVEPPDLAALDAQTAAFRQQTGARPPDVS